MIDIVVTYVYERNKEWAQNFHYWKEKEILEHKTSKDNRQAFGIERTREWDMFKYWFRAVEQNCPWINKIFLIVQNEQHIPKWLDKNQVRIVYHNEYIPNELLPTFNAMTIGMYVSNIKDLSEHYIMSDDDFYFLNPIDKERFFKDGKPVHENNVVTYEPYYTGNSDGVFFQILNNNLKFEERFGKEKYGIYHLPEARLKSFEQDILTKYKDEILEHFTTSKFRHPSNLCAYMYSDLLKLCNKAYIGKPYENCSYCTLKSSVNFDNYKDKSIVCFNDTEQLDDFNYTRNKLEEFLKKKFPNKSKYEV